MRGARVVVCHAGVGSMMLARRCGVRPVVMARRVHLGEAVDDHQLPLARRLHEAGAVELVDDAAQLAAAVPPGSIAPRAGSSTSPSRASTRSHPSCATSSRASACPAGSRCSRASRALARMGCTPQAIGL